MRTSSFALAAALAAAVAITPAHAASPARSSYPGGRYTPPAATYGTSVDDGVRVRMSDGSLLKLDIVYPTDPATGKRARGPFPVLLTQDQYQSGALGVAESTSVYGAYFVQRGYIFVHLNVRGTGGNVGVGGSEGMNDFFGPRTGLDGVEAAYWAANPRNLPGSSGRVGLEGCSALGITQLSTLNQMGRLEREHGKVYVPGRTPADAGHTMPATLATSPIKASIPQCLSGDFYRDTMFDNGIPSTIWDLYGSGPALSGVNASDPRANVDADEMLVNMAAGADVAYERQFWQDRNWVLHADDLARTGVPALMWVGWGEGGYMGAQWLYAALQNSAAGRPSYLPMKPSQKPSPKYQAIIGDWGHAGGLDPGIELEWYDTWLKGIDTGLRSAGEPMHMKELPSAATSRWINTTTYPMTDKYTPYYLATGSALSTGTPKTAGTEALAWTPGLTTTYTIGSPFTQDMTLVGPPAVRVWGQSSNANMQIYAELDDVAPDGTSTHISHGSILASMRQQDPTRSWSAPNNHLPIQPSLTLDHQQDVAPNTPIQLDIPIEPVTWRLLKGHKLALVLGGQATESQCALNTKIGASPTGCQWTKPMLQTLPGGIYTILHDPKHPSVVNLPLVPSSSLKTARSGATPTSAGVALPQDWG